MPTQRQVAFFWNGRIADAKAAPEGNYRAEVRLELLEKTITLPNESRRHDAAKVTVTATRPLRISPDGDRRTDSVTVTYVLDEPARAALFANGVRRVLSHVRARARPARPVRQ